MTAQCDDQTCCADDQQLSAPSRYSMPEKLDAAMVADLWKALDSDVRQEITTVPEKSVLYELVQSFVAKFGGKDQSKVQLGRCFEFFRYQFSTVELDPIVADLQKAFGDAIETKSKALHFEAILRTVRTRAEHVRLCTSVAEEVDAEVLCFNDDVPSCPAGGRIFHFEAPAKTAYSLAMYMWTRTHMMLKRLAVVGRRVEQEPHEITPREVRVLLRDQDTFQTKQIGATELKEEGNQMFRNQRYEEAAQRYTGAVQRSPTGDDHQWQYYCNRAACYLQLKEYQRAIDDCNASLKLNAKAVKALYRRAQAYEGLGKKQCAITDLNDLLSQTPQSSEAKTFLERLHSADAPSRDDWVGDPSLSSSSLDGAIPLGTGGSSTLDERHPRENEENLGPEPEPDVVANGADEKEKKRKKKKRKKNKKSADEESEAADAKEEEEEMARVLELERLLQEEEAQRRKEEEERQRRVLREEKAKRQQEQKERERQLRLQKEREDRERRERIEREKRERKAREEAERREREEREKKEKEERERARRQKEKEKREVREREEKEKKDREKRKEKERKEREDRDRREKEEKEKKAKDAAAKATAAAKRKPAVKPKGKAGGGGQPSPPSPQRGGSATHETPSAPPPPPPAGPAPTRPVAAAPRSVPNPQPNPVAAAPPRPVPVAKAPEPRSDRGKGNNKPATLPRVQPKASTTGPTRPKGSQNNNDTVVRSHPLPEEDILLLSRFGLEPEGKPKGRPCQRDLHSGHPSPLAAAASATSPLSGHGVLASDPTTLFSVPTPLGPQVLDADDVLLTPSLEGGAALHAGGEPGRLTPDSPHHGGALDTFPGGLGPDNTGIPTPTATSPGAVHGHGDRPPTVGGTTDTGPPLPLFELFQTSGASFFSSYQHPLAHKPYTGH